MKNYLFIFAFSVFTVFFSCKSQFTNKQNTIEVQAHRGDRGYFPENTLPAFYSAIDKGADVIELDLVISRDKKVVVSHDTFMHSSYVTSPNGKPVTKEEEKKSNLYAMAYDSIRRYDVGVRSNPVFPDQKSIKTYKPLLSELIDSIEAYIVKNKKQRIRYNIEIKSGSGDYGIKQPQPSEFADLTLAIIKEKKIEKYCNVQSFDPQILNALHQKAPKIRIAILTGDKGFAKNLAKLNFQPEIYAPHYGLVNQALIDSVRSQNMKIIPWTVNENKDIESMISLKVDGIITDYPDRVIEKLKK
ncbi:glycerophosphodiester phosphodiesterase family protein [uncultured Flavobacterium sp.]|uniref:glycerophosphodiester phosphodiesterase family protein n=1 Tax=uncultured Flavobacterium sp. TaxID=165435 RepID=UPI0025E15809|nr:glycerophosphodiester phosphodiesterase family protein [uncultured Flavobacterium sp.]